MGAMTFETAVQRAIGSERAGERFYRRVAGSVRDEEARTFLEGMAAEEAEHGVALETLARGELGFVPLDLEVPEELASPEVTAELASGLDMDLDEALDLALDAEHHAAYTYAQLAFSTQGDVSRLFEGMARTEERHAEVIEALMARLAGSAEV